MKLERFLVVVFYLLAIFLSWAIIRYMILFEMEIHPEEADSLIFTRVFISAPGLLIIGCTLLLAYKKVVHKIFGCIFIFEVTFWAVLLIQAIKAESA